MLNKVNLIGNVGNEPEVKSFSNGSEYANFSLATTEYWKDKTGERKSQTEWHKIAVYNENLVKLVKNYITKGSKIYLEGQIKYEEYDKDGEKRFSTKIVLSAFNGTIKLLDSKNSENKETSKEERDYTEEGDSIPF